MTRNAPPDIGVKIKSLRSELKLTLDQLAKASGVSKSMLSQIERGMTNPTVATLWSLTQSLNIDIAELLRGDNEQASTNIILEVTKAHQIPEIRSADGKCDLRILGPIDKVSEVEWYDLILEPNGLLESDGHTLGTMEHLTVLEGQLSVRNERGAQIISVGDTARYQADIPHYIENTGLSSARALMIVLSPSNAL